MRLTNLKNKIKINIAKIDWSPLTVFYQNNMIAHVGSGYGCTNFIVRVFEKQK